jgi:hypothetical protein
VRVAAKKFKKPRKGNILCLPIEEFLLALTPEMKDLYF